MKLIIILFISLGVSANTLTQVKVNKIQMSRYIMPQMKSILKDFSAFENLVDPKIKELKIIKSELIKINKKLTTNNYKDIDSNYKKIKQTLYKLNLMTSKYSQLDRLSHQITSHDSVKLYFENCLSFNKGCIQESKSKFIHTIEQSLAYINTIRYFALNPKLKGKIKIVWNEFIKKISTIRKDRKRIKAMGKNLVELNYAWHEFNKFMTINKKSYTKESLKHLNYINNRWKAILKTVL
jgi:hypothetical protein